MSRLDVVDDELAAIRLASWRRNRNTGLAIGGVALALIALASAWFGTSYVLTRQALEADGHEIQSMTPAGLLTWSVASERNGASCGMVVTAAPLARSGASSGMCF